jgi:putative ABC transport system permease protein
MSTGLRYSAGQSLDQSDVETLSDKAVVPDVRAVAPITQTYAVVGRGDGTGKYTSVIGTNTQYPLVMSRTIAAGRFFTQAETDAAQPVVVLGSTVAVELFGGAGEALTGSVVVGGSRFQVIGILESAGSSMMGSMDEIVLMPWSTLSTRLGEGSTAANMILLSGASEDTLNLAHQEATAALLMRHGLAPEDADFNIQSQLSLISAMDEITSALSLLLGGLAAISLLVGGIGVMNIMLVSVTERIREIGLRKALGATPNLIRVQFLAEATVLALVGGVLGLALGYLVAFVFPSFTDLVTIEISLPTAMLAMGVSAAVGIIAGVYPASRAASLAPIDALRAE